MNINKQTIRTMWVFISVVLFIVGVLLGAGETCKNSNGIMTSPFYCANLTKVEHNYCINNRPLYTEELPWLEVNTSGIEERS